MSLWRATTLAPSVAQARDIEPAFNVYGGQSVVSLLELLALREQSRLRAVSFGIYNRLALGC